MDHFCKNQVGPPRNMLTDIESEPPDRIVHLKGDPYGSTEETKAKERGEYVNQPEVSAVHYREAEKIEDQM